MSTRVFHPVSCLWVLHSAAAAAMLILASRGLLSSDPLAALNSTSVRLIRLIDDFLIHLSVYTTITMILLPLVIKHRTGIQRVLVGSIMFHALATELLQRTIPRRACDPIDMAANLLGKRTC